jgi:hypothetical protein
VVCSASTDLTTMRSSSGLMETDTMRTSPSGMSEWTGGWCWYCGVVPSARRAVAVAGVDRLAG